MADLEKPFRVQRKRTRGWKMPPNTVCVSRPGKWGNPYRVGKGGVRTTADAVELYRARAMDFAAGYLFRENVRKELRGKNLACWCPLPKDGEPDLCHAAVLLEIANG